MKRFLIVVPLLFMFLSPTHAAIPPFPGKPFPSVRCTFNDNVLEKYNDRIEVYANKIYFLLNNKSMIKEVCKEPVPDELLQSLVGLCQVAGPGKYIYPSLAAGTEPDVIADTTSGPVYTIYGSGWAYRYSEVDGWNYVCATSYNGPDTKQSDVGMDEFTIIAIILAPNILAGISVLWAAFLLVILYLGATLYRKQKLVNPYLIPVVFGPVGGVVAYFAWKKNKRERNLLLAMGFLSTAIVFLPEYMAILILTA